MNLLIVSGFWPSVSNPVSGIFVAQQAAALSRAGNCITVVIPTTLGKGQLKLCSHQDLNLDENGVRLIEVPVVRLPEKLSSLPGAIQLNTAFCGIMLGRHIRGLCKGQRFDGCIVHGTRYGGLSLPMWRQQIHGRAAIVVHGVDPFMADPNNQRRAHPLFERAGLASNAVVLVGRPLLVHATSLGFPPDKLRIVPNGTDLPPAQTVSAKQRPRAQVRRVVSVSHLVPLKGVDDNLHALAIIAKSRPDLEWEYRIVGDGPYRGELERLTRELGIDRRVAFLGRIAYAATMQEISESDVFSLPSWGEAFGIVYLEAMARMRPVVGCFANGAADILTDGVDGRLVPPRDIPALACALTRLLEDPDACTQMGRAGRATAETMSWDENARRMLRLLIDEHT